MQKYFFLLLIFSLSSCISKTWVDNYSYIEYEVSGRNCILVRPKTDPNGEWIVRPAFIGDFSQVDDSLLLKGYTMAFCDVTHEYGNKRAQSDFYNFYKYTRDKYHLKDKFIIEGFSRGGFFALTFAENYPHCIKKIYVDAPVCDLYSWPQKKDSLLFNEAQKKWQNCGVDIKEIHDYPIVNFSRIKNIPLIVVYGTNDSIVPFAENFGLIKIGDHQNISILKKIKVGHHPHSLQPCDTIVNFLMK